MNIDDLAKIDQPALDRLVAEKVMGWTLSDGWVVDARHIIRFPSCVANDDYEVLRHVREKWDQEKQQAFIERLEWWWCATDCRHYLTAGVERFAGCVLSYKPGDYSLAALAVVMSVPAPANPLAPGTEATP